MKKRELPARTLDAPSPDYAAGGDLLRVFCALMVAWFHIWQQSWLSPSLQVGRFRLDYTPQVRTGYMYVDLMLMLSGFLLYLPYANRREHPAGAFYLRRALRILPSYWLCLAVMMVYAVLQSDFSNGARLMQDLGLHLGFVHNLFAFSYTSTRLNVVLWTLAVEVQFYLLVPVLAPAFRRQPVLVYLGMTGAALAFRNLWTAQMSDTTLFINRLPNMLDVYANGMLAAHLYAALARRKDHRALIAAAGTVLAVAAVWWIFRLQRGQAHIGGYEEIRHGQMDRRFMLSACGAAFVLGASLSFRPLRAVCSNRLVRFLSGISFNFYIWHQWLAVRLKQWRIPPYQAEVNPNQVGEMPWMWQYTLTCFAAALLAAVLVTYLVEKPAARFGRRWIRRVEKAGKKGNDADARSGDATD